MTFWRRKIEYAIDNRHLAGGLKVSLLIFFFCSRDANTCYSVKLFFPWKVGHFIKWKSFFLSTPRNMKKNHHADNTVREMSPTILPRVIYFIIWSSTSCRNLMEVIVSIQTKISLIQPVRHIIWYYFFFS